MEPCTHPGTSRGVGEVRGLILAAGRVRSKKKKTKKRKRNPITLKTHHEIHGSPATATSSRLRATKHVARVSPCLHASIDPGFVEIDLAQLSQSVKTTRLEDTCTTLLACQLAAGRKLRDATPL